MKHIIALPLLITTLVLAFVTPVFAAGDITQIPATQELRKAELDKLQAESTLSEEQQRYLWFVKSTYWAVGKNAEFEQIEALDKEIANYLKQHPKDYELMAARGSLVGFKATYFLRDLNKVMRYGGQGNRLMDRAVSAAPDNLGARLQRGINSAVIPMFLKRAHLGVKDLTYIKEHAGDEFDAGFYHMVDTFLALAYRNDSNRAQARVIWNSVIASGDPVWSKEAAKLLKAMGG